LIRLRDRSTHTDELAAICHIDRDRGSRRDRERDDDFRVGTATEVDHTSFDYRRTATVEREGRRPRPVLMSGRDPSRPDPGPDARAGRCTHCGAPAFGRVSLVFEGEVDSRELDLRLCDRCVESFTAEPDVRLAE